MNYALRGTLPPHKLDMRHTRNATARNNASSFLSRRRCASMLCCLYPHPRLAPIQASDEPQLSLNSTQSQVASQGHLGLDGAVERRLRSNTYGFAASPRYPARQVGNRSKSAACSYGFPVSGNGPQAGRAMPWAMTRASHAPYSRRAWFGVPPSGGSRFSYSASLRLCVRKYFGLIRFLRTFVVAQHPTTGDAVPGPLAFFALYQQHGSAWTGSGAGWPRPRYEQGNTERTRPWAAKRYAGQFPFLLMLLA